MEKAMKITKGASKVTLALLAGVLMPVLLWIALGVAADHKLQGRRLQRKAAPTIGDILAAAGLSIHEEATPGKTVAAKTFGQVEIRELLAKAGLTIHDEAAPADMSKQIPARANVARA